MVLSAEHLLETKPPKCGSLQALGKLSLLCLITAEHPVPHFTTVSFCLAISNPCQYCYPLPHTIKNNNNKTNPASYHLHLLFTLFTRGVISLMSNSSQTTQISQFHFLRQAGLAGGCSGPAGCCCNQPHATGGRLAFSV